MSNTQSKQKPYGYLKLSNSKFYREVEGVVDIDNDPGYLALYTHSPVPQEHEPKRVVSETHKWVGLTDQEIAIIGTSIYGSHHWDDMRFYLEVEKKLKERNT